MPKGARRRPIYVALLICVSVAAWYSPNAVHAVGKRLHLISEYRVPDGQPAITFAEKVQSFGRISNLATPSAYTFSFVNTSSVPIRIRSITSSCGCIVTKFDRGLIAPQRSGDVVLSLDPRGKRGQVTVKALVTLDKVDRPYVLTLAGEIYEPFTISPAIVDFGQADLSRRNYQEVIVTNNTTREARVAESGLTASLFDLDVVTKVIKPGGTGKLVIATTSTTPVGAAQDEAHVRIPEYGEQELRIPIRCWGHTGGIVAVPRAVAAGFIKNNSAAVRVVELRSLSGKEFEIVSARESTGTFVANFSPGMKSVHRVSIASTETVSNEQRGKQTSYVMTFETRADAVAGRCNVAIEAFFER